MASLFLVVCFLNRNNTLVEHCSKSKDHLNHLIMKKNIYFREIVYFVAIRSCNQVKKKATDEVQKHFDQTKQKVHKVVNDKKIRI